MRILPVLVFGFLSAGFLPLQSAWRSSLYPADWVPPESQVFHQAPFLQDFSHAGYGYGQVPLPRVEGPVFDATDFGADPGGTIDSTAAIQAAIDACEAAGGGVVFLPAGLYRVAPPSGRSEALKIGSSHVVLRGAGTRATRILNTATLMRNKAVIRVDSGLGGWLEAVSTKIPVTADRTGPTREIPVADVSGFSVGESVVVRAEATPAWIVEHDMDSATYWLGQGGALGGIAYYRDIAAMDAGTNTLILDTPIRYPLKTRDNASVYRAHPPLTGVGIEFLSIGNVEHPGSDGWGEEDYQSASNNSYDVHDSWLISTRNLRHSWIRGVHSFQAEGNTGGTHLLSNGILVENSRHVTVRDCDLAKVQYGGGGGNGYIYRLKNSQEVLVADCAARYQRHGFVVSHMQSSGNVFRRVFARETHRQTAGAGTTQGGGSDHHQHFSQAMLFDQAVADADYFSAHFRRDWGGVAHALTSTGSVYWNTRGEGGRPKYGFIVESDQWEYGYIIGTSGDHSTVKTSLYHSRTSPVDFTEGIGTGDTLEPASLYADQLVKRAGIPLADPVVTPDPHLNALWFGARADALLTAGVDWGMAEPSGRLMLWSQVSGPAPAEIARPDEAATLVRLPQPGVYVFQCRVDNGWASDLNEVALTLEAEPTVPREAEAAADAFVRGDPYQGDNYGSGPELLVKKSRAEFWRESYVKLPLPGDPSGAVDAYVELTVLDAGDASPVEVFTTASGWTEAGLTWSGKPAKGVSLGTFVPAAGVVRIPVALPLLENLYALSEPLAIGLTAVEETVAITTIASRESADASLRPRLLLRHPAPSEYVQWAEAEFGGAVVADATLENPVWGASADPDGDGVRNAFERMAGTDPEAGTPEVFRLGPGPAVEVTLTREAPVPEAEYSLDLAAPDGWTGLPVSAWRVVDTRPGTVTLRLPLPEEEPVLHIRLRVDGGE